MSQNEAVTTSADVGRVSNPVIEAMATCRATRRYTTEPVPDELVETVLYAATRASSPMNTQPWAFIVVRDPEQRRRLGEVYKPHLDQVVETPADAPRDVKAIVSGHRHILGNLADIPVLVFVCGRSVAPELDGEHEVDPSGGREGLLSAIFAASQNFLVAARSLGLGAGFTMLHATPGTEEQLREIVEMPEDVVLGVILTLGWPARPGGLVNRKPLESVVHYDRW